MKLNKNQSLVAQRGVNRLGNHGIMFLLALGPFLAACKHDSSSAQATGLQGSYRLVAINGNKLPFAPPHEGGTAPQIRSGVITLNADGTHNSSMTYGMPSGTEAGRNFSGTYTQQGSRLKLQWNGAGITFATLESNAFTMDNEGVLYLYRK